MSRTLRRSARARSRAFTLIELMIVVAIVGVLAVLALYGVRKMVAHAKTAEATNSLGMISQDAVTQAAVRQGFCGSASASVPSSPSLIKGQKYQSTVTEWNVDQVGGSGFACLGFEMDAPQYYMYSYAASNSSFTGLALGDLNGDGVLSTYQIVGAVNANGVLNVAGNMLVVDGDE